MTLSSRKLLAILNETLLSIDKNCPKCGEKAILRENSIHLMRCTWKSCRKAFSLFRETPFHSNKIPLEIVLKVIRMWCSKVQGKAIAELLELNKNTVSRIINTMAKRLIPQFNKNIEKIGGPGIIVEIDESKFGKVKYHRGHKVEGVWVFGMVERTEARKIVFVKVDNRKQETLEGILKKYVHEETIIYSDCWRAYNNLCNLFASHNTVNHSQTFVDPLTNVHTNTIEGNWAGVKEQISPVHRTKTYIDLYLIRYVLRRNYKDKIFEKVIKLLFS
jgi:transposase-like protein